MVSLEKDAAAAEQEEEEDSAATWEDSSSRWENSESNSRVRCRYWQEIAPLKNFPCF